MTDPITTICRTCGVTAYADRGQAYTDPPTLRRYTGHWFHTSPGYFHNVDPRPEDLARLRHALLTERA
jgi:hypothetical protein